MRKIKLMLAKLKVELLLLLIIFLWFPEVNGQDKDYARRIIDTLTSPAMHGRGYVNNGDKKAAQFIAEEFQRIGLKKFTNNYFQNFKFPVNAFPGKMEVKINSRDLVPGQDYLVWPSSPGFKINTEAIYLDQDELMDARKIIYRAKKHKKMALIADLSGFTNTEEKNQAIENLQVVSMNLEKHPIIWLTDDKLTWSPARHISQVPIIQIKRSALDEIIQEVTMNIDNQYYEQYQSQNVIGYLPGKSSDSLLVLTAHYDHLGRMGAETYFPGANDNASGVAMMLNLARHFARMEKNPAYDMVFIAFGAEEAGLIGSRYFVDNPLIDLQKVKFLINLDLAGTGDDGITVVNATVFPDKFYQLQNLNRQYTLLTQVKQRGEACNSDHCFFFMAGVPCFYIYTLGGITAYHDIHDKAATLPLTEYNDYFTLLKLYLQHLMNQT